MCYDYLSENCWHLATTEAYIAIIITLQGHEVGCICLIAGDLLAGMKCFDSCVK